MGLNSWMVPYIEAKNHIQSEKAAASHMNDPFGFGPSRTPYESGFLMSSAQSNVTPPGGQRFTDPSLFPTKSELLNSRTSPSNYGLESIFESPRRQRRPPPRDEDGPPLASVRDIPWNPRGDQIPMPRKLSPPGSPLGRSTRRRTRSPKQPLPQPMTYLKVFGYPPDRYDTIALMFQNLGDTTEPEPSETGLWFTIGFRQPLEAERALRRNGNLMEDAYLLGVARIYPSLVDIPGGSPSRADSFTPGKDNQAPPTNTVGVPFMLAPSTSAFRAPSPKQPTEPGFGVPYVQPLHDWLISKVADIVFNW